MELPLTTPSPEHGEFDQMCSQVDEFGLLPTVSGPGLEPESEGEEEISLDDQILAGLVTP